MDGAGNILRRFIPDGSGAMDGRLASLEANGTIHWHHTDHQGSVVATSNASGAPVSLVNYSPNGELGTALDGTSLTAPPTGSPFGYTGRQYDPETGLWQYRARYYHPQLGQFLSHDPIGTKDDPNLYLYVANDPMNRTDPTGRQSLADRLKDTAQSYFDAAAAAARTAAATAAEAAPAAGSRAAAVGAGALAGGVALAAVPSQLGSDDTASQTYVVRAGIATAEQLANGTADSQNGHGYSVQSQYNVPWQELARGGNFPNGQVSVSQVGALTAIPGVTVNIDTPGRGQYHSTVNVNPAIAPPNVNELMSATYRQYVNPYPRPK